MTIFPFCNGALAQAAAQANADKESTCFDFVWQESQDDPWFLDREGRRIIPEVTRDWLAVDFAEPSDSSDSPDLTDSLADFRGRYAEIFDYRLTVPDPTNRVLYRVRRGLPFGTFDTLVKRLREDSTVRFIQPVWRIGNQLHAPPDQIDVIWKTVTPPQERRQLLETAGAAKTVALNRPDAELVRIDPCRRAPWKAAVLLAGDLRAVSAVPRLWEIEPPVAIRFDVDVPGALIGTPIPFRLQIRFRDGIRIESSTLANLDLRPGGISRNLYEIHFDRPLSSLDLTSSPIMVSGHLQVFAPGETVLPAVPVYYIDSREDGDQRKIHSVSTRATPLRVAAMVPETPGDHRLQVAPPVVPVPLTLPGLAGRLRTAAIMSAAGFILLAAAIGGWWWLNRKKAPKDKDLPELLRRQRRQDLIDWTRRDTTTMGREDWAAFGEALKDYLGEMAGLPPESRGGGHDFFLRKLENRLFETDRAQAAILLREIDHLVADGPNTGERLAWLFEKTQALIKSLETPRRDRGG